jgi:hypothetical protein
VFGTRTSKMNSRYELAATFVENDEPSDSTTALVVDATTV